MSEARSILITGGAGFIGSHLVRYLVEQYSGYQIINLDKLTYAGNLANLQSIENQPHYRFVKGDICDAALLEKLFETYSINTVIHLAAESHVDRSIEDPLAFIQTNVVGTAQLLNQARIYWKDRADVCFYHVSTDEVYGTLGSTGFFTEETAYDPRSPYSASKASSDHLVRAYYHTYGLPVKLSNCSNNYGPYQFPEKLIPLVINNIRSEKTIPIYGDGQYTRDWLWVEDHVRAMDLILHKGAVGATYNIGGHNEWTNLDLVHLLCDIMDDLLGRPPGSSRQLIQFVKDRPGHDRRYAIDASKIEAALNWRPTVQMEEGLRRTAQWYLQHRDWLEQVTSGAYLEYYENQYNKR